MKKLIALLMTGALSVGLMACGTEVEKRADNLANAAAKKVAEVEDELPKLTDHPAVDDVPDPYKDWVTTDAYNVKKTSEDGQNGIAYQSKMDPEDVRAFYRTKLQAAGAKEVSLTEEGNTYLYVGTLADGRGISVGVTPPVDGETPVAISIADR